MDEDRRASPGRADDPGGRRDGPDLHDTSGARDDDTERTEPDVRREMDDGRAFHARGERLRAPSLRLPEPLPFLRGPE